MGTKGGDDPHPGSPGQDHHAPVGVIARQRIGALITEVTPSLPRDTGARLGVVRGLIGVVVASGRAHGCAEQTE